MANSTYEQFQTLIDANESLFETIVDLMVGLENSQKEQERYEVESLLDYQEQEMYNHLDQIATVSQKVETLLFKARSEAFHKENEKRANNYDWQTTVARID